MKIIYFGTDVFLDTFIYLLQNHEILALYTYYNEEDYFNENNIVHIAKSHGIPVHYEQINEEEMVKYIEQDGCRMFFVAEYCYKLPVPSNPLFHGINLHSSLLPQGRSYYPIECAMERGLEHGGITAHKLASKLDRGDILCNRSFPITELDDSVDMYLYCGRAAREMVEEIFTDFESCWKRGVVQEEILPYWKRPAQKELTLRHDMTKEQAKEVYRKFNKMTMVELEEKMFYVDGFSTGNASIGADGADGAGDKDVIFIRDARVLYSVSDGHLRLDVKALPTK